MAGQQASSAGSRPSAPGAALVGSTLQSRTFLRISLPFLKCLSPHRAAGAGGGRPCACACACACACDSCRRQHGRGRAERQGRLLGAQGEVHFMKTPPPSPPPLTLPVTRSVAAPFFMDNARAWMCAGCAACVLCLCVRWGGGLQSWVVWGLAGVRRGCGVQAIHGSPPAQDGRNARPKRHTVLQMMSSVASLDADGTDEKAAVPTFKQKVRVVWRPRRERC